MPSILFTQGFRFFFFSQEDNEPPHIHVEHGDNTDISSQFKHLQQKIEGYLCLSVFICD
ncbi:MAG: hypothetical protein CVU29_06465 [Betaproteobacteria bacterium HGW-Betaproteobacteria-22]|nr:MAG: hypothetical protein CVU29_06465 [Betaproteobacteria bacterium HGW-Betaproteobacteria-22]